jgi:hypothetical protein
MALPLGICTPDPADQTTGWVVLALIAATYFGLLYLSVRRTSAAAWFRIGATWLVPAAGLTMFVLWAEEAGLSDPVIVLVCFGVVVAVTLAAMGVRGPEAAWRYVTAGVLGGITPIVFFVVLVATLYATGGCLG